RPFQRVDIGAIVDVGRRQNVSLAMPRQKYDRQPGDHAMPDRSRGLAPRALDRLVADILQPRQVVDAGSTDNAKHGIRHDCSPEYLSFAPVRPNTRRVRMFDYTATQ